MAMATVITLIILVPLMIFAGPLCSLFNQETEVIGYGVYFIRLISPSTCWPTSTRSTPAPSAGRGMPRCPCSSCWAPSWCSGRSTSLPHLPLVWHPSAGGPGVPRGLGDVRRGAVLLLPRREVDEAEFLWSNRWGEVPGPRGPAVSAGGSFLDQSRSRPARWFSARLRAGARLSLEKAGRKSAGGVAPGPPPL